MLDTTHSLALMDDAAFERGLLLISEGCCPHCATPLTRTEKKDGTPVGQCPVSEWGYRLEHDPVHGPSLVSTGKVSLRVVSVPDQPRDGS